MLNEIEVRAIAVVTKSGLTSWEDVERDNPQFLEAKAFNAVFNAPRAGHSVKPDVFYALLRRVSPEPRLDMFSRREIEGFTGWGNE